MENDDILDNNPWRLHFGIEAAIKKRDAAAIRNILRQLVAANDDGYVAHGVARYCSAKEMAWFFDNGFFSVNYVEEEFDDIGTPLIIRVISMNNTSCAKLDYLIRAKANIECDSIAGTPLQYALEYHPHAVAQLLLAGASVATLGPHALEKLTREWLPRRVACQRSICALLWCCATSKQHFWLPKDVARIVARRVWVGRYEECWK